MNRKVLIIGAAIVVPFIILLTIGLKRDPRAIKSPLIGKPAPQFALRDVSTGTPIDLAALRGKPVVVNFWATWCIPCFEEHQILRMAAANAGSNVQFLGVIYNDEPPKILQFLSENGSSYPTLVDDQGKTAIAYGIYGVPETFFISPEGVIAAKHEGPLDPNALANYIAQISGGRS